MRAVWIKIRNMKKTQKKARIPTAEPIIIKIDQKSLRAGLVLPRVEYEVVARFESEEIFHGMVIPIPRVLVNFLTNGELKIVVNIMEESNRNGECKLTVMELAARNSLSATAVSNHLYNLRKMGLLRERSNGIKGAGRFREINYKTVQHLNDLVEGEDPGIYARIRKAIRKKEISNITRGDLKMAYDTQVLPPGHDPAEEEEYN